MVLRAFSWIVRVTQHTIHEITQTDLKKYLVVMQVSVHPL
jgi:hypothetical protein